MFGDSYSNSSGIKKAASAFSTTRSIFTNVKLKAEKFDDTYNFYIWQCEVMNIICKMRGNEYFVSTRFTHGVKEG